MNEIRFYQMSRTKLPLAVVQLAQKVRASKNSLDICVHSDELRQTIDEALWSDAEFLPHSVGERDGVSEITLISGDQPSVDAEVLFLIDKAEMPARCASKLICYLFHAVDQDVVNFRRDSWIKLKDEGHFLTYWAQDENGAWQKKTEANLAPKTQ